MEMPSFTQIKEVVNAILTFLREFFLNVENMFANISYEFAGYPEEEL